MDNYDIEQAVNTYIYMVEKKCASRANSSLIQKTLLEYLNRQLNIEIETTIDFSKEQVDEIYMLNDFCVYQSLYDNEVVSDIRKIGYITNQMLKKALIAFGLTASLISPTRRQNETKEFFEENITVKEQTKDKKIINFGNIVPKTYTDTINQDIIDDWMIFADKRGMGIKSLIDYKTELSGMDDFYQGGDSVFLFARFQRKMQETLNVDAKKAKNSAQEAFRNSLVSSIATKFTEQQMLEGKSIDEMMAMVETLFMPNSDSAFKKNTKQKKSLPKNNQQKRIGNSRKR